MGRQAPRHLGRAFLAFLRLSCALGALTIPMLAQASTGLAGATINNLPPAIDALQANPRTSIPGHEVRVTGTAHDDNGHEDVGSVTVKVTRPSGGSAVLATTLAAGGADATTLSFAATYAVAAGDEAGTYQVDSFATDATGAQSAVESTTFRVIAPSGQFTSAENPHGAGYLDFGRLDPGAIRLQSQNAMAVAPGSPGERLSFDMADFACAHGEVPVLGNADLLLGTSDRDGGFLLLASKPYTESVVEFGTVDESVPLLVKLRLHHIPSDIGGLCTASFGLYHAPGPG
ncbi:MAG: hypothetical protein LC623_00170 [Halobacteriales archaeon]|nr:hypothetical protein [Halobacteriales archaeon]